MLTEREAVRNSYKFAEEVKEALREKGYLPEVPERAKKFAEVFERLARDAKKYSSLVLSDGLIDATLFIFSKAKEGNINRSIGDLIPPYEEVGEGDVLSEPQRWAIISKFVCRILSQTLGISNPLEILGKLLELEESKVVELERDALLAINALARIFEARGVWRR